MFLLDRTGFLALIGLFLQTGLSWLFVAMFAAMRPSHDRVPFFRGWILAFSALAVGLTALSVRFFFAFDVGDDNLWDEGRPAVRLCYCIYLGTKTVFALQLLDGAGKLRGRSMPPLLARLRLPLIAIHALLPLWLPNVEMVLLAHAPVMLGCCVAALWQLRPAADVGGDVRFVRFALAGMVLAWVLHAVASGAVQSSPQNVWWFVTQFNTYLDLALEFVLGAGLIVAHLHGAQLRLQVAQAEQQRLQQQLDRNEKLRAIGTLVSGVAHELNNPLTAILGFAELLGKDSAAQVVREQAERCRGIVRSLSTLAGDCAHARERVDCRELALRVVRGLQPQLDAAAVALDLQLDGGVPPVLADRFGIEQVLTNLLLNAIQVTAAGCAVVLRLRAGGGHVEFAVIDAGPGVPAALRPRLFEPFFTTKAPGKGTGLGLAVAHAIVHSHAGQIVISEADSGRGSCFTVRLPIGEAPAPEPVAAAAAPAGGAVLHLLLVDDEAAVRMVVRQRAEQQQWRVTEAATAEDALLLLADAAAGFDAILCDLRMPGIGGIGLHDQLQQQAPHWLSRCVFFTGDLASPRVAAFARRCRSPLLQKPFDFPALLQRLADIAARASSTASA